MSREQVSLPDPYRGCQSPHSAERQGNDGGSPLARRREVWGSALLPKGGGVFAKLQVGQSCGLRVGRGSQPSGTFWRGSCPLANPEMQIRDSGALTEC